jgi:hypothetical protein
MATDPSQPYDQVARLIFPNGVVLPITVNDQQPDGTFLPISILKGIPMRADDANNTKIELQLNVKTNALAMTASATGRFKRG